MFCDEFDMYSALGRLIDLNIALLVINVMLVLCCVLLVIFYALRSDLNDAEDDLRVATPCSCASRNLDCCPHWFSRYNEDRN